MADVDKKNDVIILLITFGLILAGSLLALFFLGGAEDPNNLLVFWTYVGTAAVFMMGLIAFALKRSGYKKNNLNYFKSLIHDPENGVLGKYDFIRNAGKLLLISLMIFSLWGIFAIATN